MAKPRTYVPKTPSRKAAAAPASPLRRYMPWIAGALLLIAAGVGIFFLVRSGTATADAPGERFPIQGQQHIDEGTSHPAYNSDPPTSGWHYEVDLPSGFYEDSHPDELLVHNLEHGHIVIWYDCSKLADCEGTKTQLKRLWDSYNGWKVTIVPRTNKDAAIALTAWGWLDKLDSFDETRIRRFIDAWRNRGPEATMD